MPDLLNEQMTEAYLEQVREKGPENVDLEEFFPAEDTGASFGNIQEDERTRTRATLYSTKDGTPSSIPIYMVGRTIRKTFKDGTPAFSVRPKVEYKQGTIKCMLHPDHEDRSILREVGLDHLTCPKANIRSVYDQRLHMEHRHQKEWKTMQEHEERKKEEAERQYRQEQQDLMRAQMESLQKNKGGRPRKNPEPDDAEG